MSLGFRCMRDVDVREHGEIILDALLRSETRKRIKTDPPKVATIATNELHSQRFSSFIMPCMHYNIHDVAGRRRQAVHMCEVFKCRRDCID